MLISEVTDMTMNANSFERLVGTGIKAYDLVSNIGQVIREYADENDIPMTETDFAEVLIEVHNRVR